MTWNEVPPPALAPVPLTGWLRALIRGAALGGVIFGGLALLLAVRLIERPLCGVRRPVTPSITVGVCRAALGIIGLDATSAGTPMAQAGVVVANHASWLDIFVLNARDRICFVAKAEVAGWPGIGWLARATGTVFIARARTEAAAQTALFAQRLGAGYKLLFFPEGTSTDGARVLPFKPTLFDALFTAGAGADPWVQPVTVAYTAPVGAPPAFYGWWGDMDLGPHLLRVLAAPRQGGVRVTYHPPRRVAGSGGRKLLAAAAEAAVREGLATADAGP